MLNMLVRVGQAMKLEVGWIIGIIIQEIAFYDCLGFEFVLSLFLFIPLWGFSLCLSVFSSTCEPGTS